MMPDGPDAPNQGRKPELASIAFEMLVLVLAVVLALWGAVGNLQGDQAYSRLATVYSLAKYGSFNLERPLGEPPNRFEQWTIDKVMVGGTVKNGIITGGTLVSSKPPVLPLLMAGEYLALHFVTGWSLDDEDATKRILYTMTATFMVGAYLLTLAFFLMTLRLFDTAAAVRGALLTALAFGTQLWGFSTTFNNHMPATGLLMIALYFALGLLSGRLSPTPWRFAVFGFAGGMVPTIDMPLGIFVFVAGLALLLKYPRWTVSFVGTAAAMPVAVHMITLYRVTGSPMPVQIFKVDYMYETAYWRHPLGIDGLNEPKPLYLFEILLGRCGIFLLYPVLLLGAVSFLRAFVSRVWPHRKFVIAGGLAFAILTAYYVMSTNNYGGESYGFRWFIGAMPVLLLMAAPLVSKTQNVWGWVPIIIVLAISIYSGWECEQVGWQSGQEWTSKIFGAAYRQLGEQQEHR